MPDDHVLESHGHGERQRLLECVLEPLRTPGRIQSHGTLLAIDSITAVVTAVSEDRTEWLGRSLGDFRSRTLEWAVASGEHSDPIRVEIDDVTYDAVVHQSGDQLLVELEPVDAADVFSPLSVTAPIRRLGLVSDPAELRRAAADEIRRISGFDRVMVYRFFDDGHGEVAAESVADDMEPYDGLHFPASDIPLQARAIYVTKLSRAISSSSDPGRAIVTDDESHRTIDLSDSELRAVSPHHLQFMRNMGQESTVSFSLVHDGRLIGMITAAHRTKRLMPLLLRRALEVLATQVTLQLVALENISQLSRALTARDLRSHLVAPIGASPDPLLDLTEGAATVLSIVDADGAIVSLDGATRSVGRVPDVDRAALIRAIGTEPLATTSLPTTHPGLAAMIPEHPGLLVAPVPGHGVVVFLRREITQTIRWLGDLSADNRDTPLSPRNSFSEWKQSVRGQSLPWGSAVDDALQLGTELAAVLRQRSQSELASLAMTDALTGLPNRRAFSQALEQVLAEGREGGLFFVDLDRFKQVNDRYGHQAGDLLLQHIAGLLRDAVRHEDIAARLGGDEFVVLCLDLPADALVPAADRIVTALATPFALGGHQIDVTASCGLIPLSATQTAAELLRGADAAMYRAKKNGRNQSSR